MSSAESPTSDTVQESFKAAEAKAVNQTAAQLRSFAAGGVGGVCAVVVGHPFDLVKVRLQTAEKGVYSGAIDVVKRTIAREGLMRVCLRYWSLLWQAIDVCRVSMPVFLLPWLG
jgi:solute carrier family 25 carnitine/acylcarnitine transporter 20/29